MSEARSTRWVRLAVFLSLAAGAREKFKAEGERVAVQIRGMIESKKVQPTKALKPIRTWLKHIPHVNGYFLEQEAKIKVDKVIRLVEERKLEEGIV